MSGICIHLLQCGKQKHGLNSAIFSLVETHLTKLLESGHPRHCKMAVLQNHPCPFLLSRLDHFECNGSLALAKRERAQLGSPKSLVIGELEEGSHGVSSGGEDKNERSTAVRVAKSLGEVKWWGLDELLADLGSHKVLYCWDNFVRPETAKDYQFLEHIESGIPVIWQGLMMRCLSADERVVLC